MISADGTTFQMSNISQIENEVQLLQSVDHVSVWWSLNRGSCSTDGQRKEGQNREQVVQMTVLQADQMGNGQLSGEFVVQLANNLANKQRKNEQCRKQCFNYILEGQLIGKNADCMIL